MNENMKKKFHFASFATEFADSAASAAAAVAVGNKRTRVSMEEDADSGIDSEETMTNSSASNSTQVSPSSSTGGGTDQPLSLVMPKPKKTRTESGEESCGSSEASSSPSTTPKVRHWKKFLKDQAKDETIKTETVVTTVAEALLSLGKEDRLQMPPPPTTTTTGHSNLPAILPLNHPAVIRPIPLTAAVRQPSNTVLPPWLSSPSSPPVQEEPENLTISNQQQVQHQPRFHTITNRLIQSPTLTSTSCSSLMVRQHQPSPLGALLPSNPLREIQTNRQTLASISNFQRPPPQMPALPLHPLPLCSPSVSAPPPQLLNKFSISRLVSTSPPKPEEIPVQYLAVPAADLVSPVSSVDSNTTTSTSSSTKKTAAADKPYRCVECKKSFSTRSGYAKHEQLHCTDQIQKSFSCKYCAKGYTSLSALKMHIRTHTLPCKCTICGKSFSRPWLLQGHVRTHTGEKPFGCDYCSRSFADKSNLRAHLQTHLQNKKYSCPGCKKTFSRMSLLNKHTDSGCLGLKSRNEECVEALIGMSNSPPAGAVANLPTAPVAILAPHITAAAAPVPVFVNNGLLRH